MSSAELTTRGLAAPSGDQTAAKTGRLIADAGAPAIKGSRIAFRWTWAVAILAVGLVAASLGYLAYQLTVSSARLPALPQEVVVERGTVVSVVNASGSVVAARQARLSFSTSGRVREVLRGVGQSVQAGEVIATLEDDNFQLQLEQARSDLRIAHLKLQQANETATPDEIAAAKATLAAAQSKVQEIKSGSEASAVAAAEAEVASTQASLATARARTAQLASGSIPAATANADQAIAAAQATLQRAEADLSRLKAGPTAEAVSAARLEVDRAKQSLLADQVGRDAACGRGTDSPGCKSANAQVWSAELGVRQAETRLQQAQAGPRAEDVAAAEATVESARKGLESARASRQVLAAGATAADLQAARSAEETARASVLAAQARLDQVRSGAKASELESAQASVANAAAALAKTSPRASSLALAEEDVRQAEIRLRRAELDLAGTSLRAPFGGVVTAVGLNSGEQVLLGNSAPAITLVAPQAMRVDATIDEADVLKLASGQDVQVNLESLADHAFAGKVAVVSALGAAQRGTTTYLVSVDFDSEGARPAPGMVANLNIVTERKDDVLVVPSRLIQRDGQQQVVNVLVTGVPERRTVQTGASNGKLTEITGGLSEGETVVAR